MEAMMDKLQANQLITIVGSAIPENNWESKDKEFSYKDEMYDVVKTDTINGQKIYRCLNDTKETTLENGFAEQIKKQQGGGKKPTTVLFLKIVCAPMASLPYVDVPILFIKTVYPILTVTKISTRCQDILHPPPTV